MNSCFCGVDSVATCLRCGQRRCAAHYIVSMSPSGRFWIAVTPTGPVDFSFPSDWGHEQVAAYAHGDAACVKCRQVAAADALANQNAQVDQHVRSYLDQPDPGKLAQLASFADDFTAGQVRQVVAATYSHLTPNRELILVQLEVQPRGRRRASVHATVRERTPAILVERISVTLFKSGDIFGVERHRVSASARSSEVSCLGLPGSTPIPQYSPAYSDSMGGDSAKILFNDGFHDLKPVDWTVDLIFPEIARMSWR